jgi:cell surface protein SprA
MTRKLEVMVFDFVQGITVDSQNGRLFFTTKEPFGELLFSNYPTRDQRKLRRCSTYNPNQRSMFYRNMYRNTSGALQDIDKINFY